MAAWLLVLLACQGGGAAPEPDERRLVEARSEQADLLEALGYVDGLVDPEAENRGVLALDEARAAPGLSLYYSRTQEQAQLIGLDGSVAHTWAFDTPEPWQHVHLDPATGDIVILMKDHGLVALDRDSKLRWERPGRYHHDLAVDDQGRLHVLARRAVSMPELHPDLDVLEDTVQVLTPQGELLEEWSVLQALRDSPYAFLLPDLGQVKARKGGTADLDLLHTNHIEILDGSLAHLSPLYAAGNVVLSLRNIHAVLILDGATRQVRWIWGPGNLTFQHHPVVLDDGRLLLFDNGRDKRSRVVEVDPQSLQIVWSYDGPPRFYSKTRGSVQRLDNGNTLITISDSGYVREVTPDGQVVWDFANPDIDDQGLRGAIWRMTRYSPGSLPFLEAGDSPAEGEAPGAGDAAERRR